MSACVEGRGRRNKDGYARQKTIRFGKQLTFAHQIALIDKLGRLPRPGFQANHHCDNPACISTEPGHLYEGTQQENIADRHARGRDARNSFPGSENGAAVLTDAHVLEIRRRYAEGGVTQSVLAAEFGVTSSNICHIVRRKSWPHLW